MTHPWDEFSKSLAEESVPRRETLRRLGAVFAGAALMPFSLALGAPKRAAPDPCKAFCNQCPKSQRSQCLAACQTCSGNTSRLCGTCGNYACCASGLTCCGGACVDLFEDYDNCGACGNACEELGPYEYGACVDGTCLYKCVTGALFCNGACIPVLSDPNNCGGCGNVCPNSAPRCDGGVCNNCQPWCPAGWCGGDGCGGECGCPNGFVCDENSNSCYDAGCPAGSAMCGDACVDLLFDGLNCGACGHQCQPLEFCSWGVCEGSCIGCE